MRRQLENCVPALPPVQPQRASVGAWPTMPALCVVQPARAQFALLMRVCHLLLPSGPIEPPSRCTTPPARQRARRGATFCSLWRRGPAAFPPLSCCVLTGAPAAVAAAATWLRLPCPGRHTRCEHMSQRSTCKQQPAYFPALQLWPHLRTAASSVTPCCRQLA